MVFWERSWRARRCLRSLNALISSWKSSRTAVAFYSPSYRLDIEGEADLAEEVARSMVRPDSRPYPAAQVIGQLTPRQEFAEAARQLLLGCGLGEIKTYSFHGESMFERLHIPTDHPKKCGPDDGSAQ